MMTDEITEKTSEQKADRARTKAIKLGRVIFSATNCDAEFARNLDVLMPSCPGEPKPEEVYELSTGCSSDIRDLINHILKRHLGCIWIDAGALLSPNGKKVLIVGGSGAGKSTTTMALALGYGWKVLAEDLLLLDQKADKIISFCSPFSLKAGTRERLLDTVNRAPEPMVYDEWSPLGDMAAMGDFDPPFDYAIRLENTEPHSPPIQITDMHSSIYLRGLLKISNILRLPGSMESMGRYLEGTRCVTFSGGSLRERLDKIRETVELL